MREKREERRGKREEKACLTCLFFLLSFFFFLSSAQAEQRFSFNDFGTLPILHEGRIKPLEAFAKIKLESLHGSARFESLSATEWLAETIFDPAKAAENKVFLIRNPALKNRLGLSQEQTFFSLIDLRPGLSETHAQAIELLQQDAKTLNAEHKEFLDLYDRAEGYNQLLRSLSLILPLEIEVPEKYKSSDEIPTYLDLVRAETRAQKELQGIIKKRGADPSRYSDKESEIAMLAFQLSVIREAGATNRLFKIMPGSWNGDRSADWFSPWELILSGQGSPAGQSYLSHWSAMARAYHARDMAAWDQASRDALDFVLDNKSETVSQSRLKAEKLYLSVKPYNFAIGFYALAIFLVFVAARYPKLGLLPDAALAGGIIFHLAGIVFRIFILQRPPVGTLYESVLFVALIVAALGLAISFLRKESLPLITGSLAAIALLFIAPVAEPDAENLDVLAAVLNTNFWLGTHVLMITCGYGICILTAMMAHGYLVKRLVSGEKPQGLYSLTYKASIAALLFTCVGTILGGIWADQSWGRFWGWDPKENGALLIVLWLVWAQHGRLSGHLRDLSFMATMACLNVIVALAWFGVNLLGAGLHSYGFTSGLATGLAIFCVLQILVIAGLWQAIRKKLC